jgi:hypothetical protein
MPINLQDDTNVRALLDIPQPTMVRNSSVRFLEKSGVFWEYCVKPHDILNIKGAAKAAPFILSFGDSNQNLIYSLKQTFIYFGQSLALFSLRTQGSVSPSDNITYPPLESSNS